MKRSLLILAVLAFPAVTQAQWLRRQPQPVRYAVPQSQPRYVYAVSQATPAPVVQVSAGDEAQAFLAGLNLWRSWYGRGPVGWDSDLAALAARNVGIHDGTPNQCWYSGYSLTAALEMWKVSPAHASILLNATVAVGASRCPSGATVNCR